MDITLERRELRCFGFESFCRGRGVAPTSLFGGRARGALPAVLRAEPFTPHRPLSRHSLCPHRYLTSISLFLTTARHPLLRLQCEPKSKDARHWPRGFEDPLSALDPWTRDGRTVEAAGPGSVQPRSSRQHTLAPRPTSNRQFPRCSFQYIGVLWNCYTRILVDQQCFRYTVLW